MKSFKNKSGASAIEYGLIAALIAVATIAAMQSLSVKLKKSTDTAPTEQSAPAGN